MPPHPAFGALPVRFDDAAADQAIAALEDLATALRSYLQVDGQLQAPLRRDWRGPARTWFDGEHAATAQTVQQAINRAQTGAEELRRAKHLAATEQLHRNTEAEAAHRVEVARLEALATPPPSP
ncbi:MAG: hypothetical protein ABI239_06310 [Aquihabitans sp.]